jgi:hypothetical protein
VETGRAIDQRDADQKQPLELHLKTEAEHFNRTNAKEK